MKKQQQNTMTTIVDYTISQVILKKQIVDALRKHTNPWETSKLWLVTMRNHCIFQWTLQFSNFSKIVGIFFKYFLGIIYYSSIIVVLLDSGIR